MSESDNNLDEMILSVASKEWQKTTMIISSVFEKPDFDKEKYSAQNVAERLYILVNNRKLESEGNMRRWRESNVRLIAEA